MMVLVCYDVNTQSPAGAKRLRKVAQTCENYGQRVQNSVFECLVDPVQLIKLKDKLEKIINTKTDSLRYYNLGKNWKTRVTHVGAKQSYDPEGIMII
jgi:CRISPR-associated protein Cas2